MSRRALIHESDLRRWARVSREEGVTIRGSLGPDGIIITVNPASSSEVAQGEDDLDARLRNFATK